MSDASLVAIDDWLEEQGWDQPARFHAILGSESDPKVKSIVELAGHPCDVLRELWREGVRVDGDAFGLALTVEGLRHLTVAEIKVEKPEAYAELLTAGIEAATEAGGDLDKIETYVQRAWEATMADVSPLSMPPDLTRRVRNTIVVLHTGWTTGVVRDIGGEPEVLDPVPPTRLTKSRVPHYMWQFLNNQEPAG